MEVDDQSPYCVYASDGKLYRLHRTMIVHDGGQMLYCGGFGPNDRRSNWCFSAMATRFYDPRQVVVIKHSQNGRTFCNWFVRNQFQWGAYNARAGGLILWQVPHDDCMNLIRRLVDLGLVPPHPFTVPHQLYPTSNLFRPEEYQSENLTALCTEVTHLQHQFEILSVRPAEQQLAQYRDPFFHRRVVPFSHARPGERFRFLFMLPDEVLLHVLDICITNLIESPGDLMLQSFLRLRLVSKLFRQEVDWVATRWAEDKYTKLHKALKSGSVESLQQVGQSLRDAGICVIFAYRSWVENKEGERSPYRQEMERIAPPPPPTPITVATYMRWKCNQRRFLHTEPPFSEDALIRLATEKMALHRATYRGSDEVSCRV